MEVDGSALQDDFIGPESRYYRNGLAATSMCRKRQASARVDQRHFA
jgi:hypothetical protein